MTSRALAKVSPAAVAQIDPNYRTPSTADEVLHQIAVVDEIKTKVMKNGMHYGKIPGCDKPALFKPGAEKLCLTFKLSHEFAVEVEKFPNQHRQYTVTCQLRYRDGTLVGQGVGICSTMESKYRYRSDIVGPVPSEYWDNRDPAALGGTGRSPKKIKGKWYVVQRVEHDNPPDYYNCVTPETLVLTHDLQWIPAGEVETGDRLIGVEENMTGDYARHLAVGEATVHGRRTDRLYEITFDDGRRVRCNGEHRWLVKKVGLKGTEWVSTQDIFGEATERKGRPRKWTVMSLCRPWEEDASKEAGYLAGLLDADGSLTARQSMVLFSQQQNNVLALMERGLAARGFGHGVSQCKSPAEVDESVSGKQVYSLRVLGGFAEQMRLLGSLRPPRLLERWRTLIDLHSRRLEGRGSGAGKPVEIVSVEAIGEGEIVMLGTTCGTYIAEGLVCHNTCVKMAKKRAHVDATLSATAASDIFDQDTEDRADDDAQTDLGSDDGNTGGNEPRAKGGDNKSTTAQHALIRGKLGAAKIPEADLLARFKVAKLEDLPFNAVNDCFDWLKERAANG